MLNAADVILFAMVRLRPLKEIEGFARQCYGPDQPRKLHQLQSTNDEALSGTNMIKKEVIDYYKKTYYTLTDAYRLYEFL